jgi:hypothetical protein
MNRHLLGKDFIRSRFAHAPGQSQEAKHCCILGLKSQPRGVKSKGKPGKHSGFSNDALHMGQSLRGLLVPTGMA